MAFAYVLYTPSTSIVFGIPIRLILHPPIITSHLLKPLLRRLPVDHIPNGAKILRLPVLILQVIRMLPRINAQQRPELSHNRVLVRVGLDADGAGLGVLDQPRPAGALDAGEGGVHFGLEVVERAEVLVDALAQGAGWRLAAAGGFGREVLPEEGVVCVAAWVDNLISSAFLVCLCEVGGDVTYRRGS